MAIALMVVSIGAIPSLSAKAATNGVTIYFKDTQSWGKAYCYAYTADTNSPVNQWPGDAMKSIGSNWYSITINSSKAINVVFTNGGKPTAKQTADVKGITGDKGLQSGSTCYCVPGGNSTMNATGIGGGVAVTVTATKPADCPAGASATAASASVPAVATPKTGDSSTAAAVGTIGVVSLAAACVLLGKKKVKA